MNTNVIENEILALVGTFCKPGTVTGFVKHLRKVEVFERELLSKTGGKSTKLRSQSVSIADRDKLEQLITLCQGTLSRHEALEVVLAIGDVFKRHGALGRAEEMYTKAVVQGEQGGGKDCVAEAFLRRSEVYGRMARWKESSADLSQSLRIFQDLKDHKAVGQVENILGANYAEQGKLRQAQAYFHRALTAFERSEHTQLTAAVLMNLGIVYNIMGQYDVALVHYQRARPHFEKIGDLVRLGELHHNMGMTYLFKSAFQDALREFELGFSLGATSQDANIMGLASLGKANVYYRLKDLRMALRLVNQSLQSFTRSNDQLSIADACKVKGMIHREMRKFAFAESYLQTSLRMNSELKNDLNTGETYFEIGLLERKRGRADEAALAFGKALTYFRKVGAASEVARTTDQMQRPRKGTT